MEFNIDIQTCLNGYISIKDYSREYNQYFPDSLIIQEHGRYKYNECKTINVITKINSDQKEIVDILIHNHDLFVNDPIHPDSLMYDIEEIAFTVKKDGYYTVMHIVLPTMDWFNNTFLQQDNNYINSFDSIYVIDIDDKYYKYVNNTFIECDIAEIAERNCIATTIEKCIIDIFYTGFLQMCYINYCRKLFLKLTKGCDFRCIPENVKEITYTRDFLWMVLNVIDYLISFKQFLEAQRILEITNYCGSFCKNQELNVGSNTGCMCS